ncbi:MAG: YceI family protein [Nitrospirae bacterium]|nr:YceI family protein [Nitrospirota bacterium]
MSKWIIDADHSVVAFSVRHMMISNVHGQFNGLSGTIYFDPARIEDSLIDVVIDASSILTGVKKRDEHLCSPDFFDAEKYPAIIFKSTHVKPASGSRMSIRGDLTMHGVTREVAMEAAYLGPVKDPFEGTMSMGFTATVTINREDYGMTWNVPMEGGLMVSKEIEISINMEADLAPE